MTEICSRCYPLIDLAFVDDDNSLVDLPYTDQGLKIYEAGFFDGMKLRVKVNESVVDISELPTFNWECPFIFPF